jgi:hypothetical protein
VVDLASNGERSHFIVPLTCRCRRVTIHACM